MLYILSTRSRAHCPYNMDLRSLFIELVLNILHTFRFLNPIYNLLDSLDSGLIGFIDFIEFIDALNIRI